MQLGTFKKPSHLFIEMHLFEEPDLGHFRLYYDVKSERKVRKKEFGQDGDKERGREKIKRDKVKKEKERFKRGKKF